MMETIVSKTSERVCHVSKKITSEELRQEIRSSVCVPESEYGLREFEGECYCLFHLPSKDKDVGKFEEKFRDRLKAVELKLTALEGLSESDREKAKGVISYDFRYVWFPSDVKIANYRFSTEAHFSSATFLDTADFESTTFSTDVNFESAIFSARAYFSGAKLLAAAYFSGAKFSALAEFDKSIFSAEAYFDSVTFIGGAEFSEATFSAFVDFSEATFWESSSFSRATFTGDTYFSSTTFAGDAYFSSAKFLETSQMFFEKTRFCRLVDFDYSLVVGYVAFEGNRDESVFLGTKAVFKVNTELNEKFVKLEKELTERGITFQNPHNFVNNQEADLNLQNVRLEKPERISFHRVRLCPSWFVNVDSRNIVFTDVNWENHERKPRNSNIAAEIEGLEKREVPEPRRLLEIACRQLADNAEKNNRYEEASKFRYMAMETKRLEYKWKGRFWTLSWWYRLSSGYGENWSRALGILLSILILFGFLYNSPFANFERTEKRSAVTKVVGVGDKLGDGDAPEFYKMNNLEGFVHSLYIAALQRPDPKPADTLTRLFVILETIFAPLQAALLALAIRRKFMR